MNKTEQDQAMRSAAVLDHEIPAGRQGDRAEFDRHGYAVSRGVLDPELLRQVRAPWIEIAIADGQVEPVEDEPDLFRWVGGDQPFDKHRGGDALRDRVDESLIRTGAASAAIESLWGRRPAFWVPWGSRKYAMTPGEDTRWHRDGWQMMGRGAPGDYVNFWIPLTRLGPGDGQLGLAVDSRSIPGRPPEVPAPHQLHLHSHLGGLPPDELLAPLWRTTSFEVGDALLFDPYQVHSGVPNDGPYLRLALALLAQDAAVSLTPRYGLSSDVTRELTDVEWLTLAVLTVQPCTRCGASCAFYGPGIIGRLWTEQPDDLVHRAFYTLYVRDLIEPLEPYETRPYTPQGDPVEGTHNHYFHPTPTGRELACDWLTTAEPTDPRLLAVRLQFCTWLDLDTTNLLRAVTNPALTQ